MGNTGCPATSPQLLEEGIYPAKRARRPCRGRSGGIYARTYWGRTRVRSPGTTHSACGSGARSAVPGLLGAGPSAGRQKGEISDIFQ